MLSDTDKQEMVSAAWDRIMSLYKELEHHIHEFVAAIGSPAVFTQQFGDLERIGGFFAQIKLSILQNPFTLATCAKNLPEDFFSRHQEEELWFHYEANFAMAVDAYVGAKRAPAPVLSPPPLPPVGASVPLLSPPPLPFVAANPTPQLTPPPLPSSRRHFLDREMRHDVILSGIEDIHIRFFELYFAAGIETAQQNDLAYRAFELLRKFFDPLTYERNLRNSALQKLPADFIKKYRKRKYIKDFLARTRLCLDCIGQYT